MEAIDPQIIRAGRLDKSVKIEYPQAKDRMEIFSSYLEHIDHDLND